MVFIYFSLCFILVVVICYSEYKRYSGDYGTKVPPLPIPNREVKLRHADGTAQVGEAVFKEEWNPPQVETYCGGFFCLYMCLLMSK